MKPCIADLDIGPRPIKRGFLWPSLAMLFRSHVLATAWYSMTKLQYDPCACFESIYQDSSKIVDLRQEPAMQLKGRTRDFEKRRSGRRQCEVQPVIHSARQAVVLLF